MINYTESFSLIASDFEANGISVETPGFYDDPNFVRIERDHSIYLNNYARFVQLKPYNDEYLKKAEKIIRIVVAELHSELVSDGKHRVCADISLILSRILEYEGVWNYVVKGALTVIFPVVSQIKPVSFWPRDTNNSVLGHAWIVAPPFTIIDLTLKQQPFEQKCYRYLPDFIIENKGDSATISPLDLYSPEFRLKAAIKGISEAELIAKYDPYLTQFFCTFPSQLVLKGQMQIKYIPCGIAAPDKPLEAITNIKLNGKYGIEIYKSRIKPKLKKL